VRRSMSAMRAGTPGSVMLFVSVSETNPARYHRGILSGCIVNAGVQGPNPRCWLKTSVPAPHYSDCCISGVLPPHEPATNRPGGDYRNFELRNAGPTGCRMDGIGDKAC